MVTGGNGTIGLPLCRLLREKGHEVFSFDLLHSDHWWSHRCDVGEFRQVDRMMKEVDPHLVYHAAAEFGRINGEDHYEQLWRTNVVGTRNVLEAQRSMKFDLVAFSSSEVYGDYKSCMFESVTDEEPIRQLNDYAISKWVNEQQVMNFAKLYGNRVVRVRLFNTYGPEEDYHPYRSAICRFIYHAMHGLPLTVYEDNKRTPIFIEDAVRTLANIPKNFRHGKAYNIAGDRSFTMRETSDMVLEALGADDGHIDYRKLDYNNAVKKNPDTRRAQTELKHKPDTPIKDGIQRTVDWQRRKYAK